MVDEYFSNETVNQICKLLLDKPHEWEEVINDSEENIYKGVMHVSGMILQWSSYLEEMWFWRNLKDSEFIDKIYHARVMEAIFGMMVNRINKKCEPSERMLNLAEDIRSGDNSKAGLLADEVIKYFNPLAY